MADQENNIIYPEAEIPILSEDENNDDGKSTSSSASKTRLAKKCPFCEDEFQLRIMFRHIRNKHPYEFMMGM